MHIYIDLHNHPYFTILYLMMESIFVSFNSPIKSFLCAVVVEESCLLSSDKNIETLHDVDMILWMSLLLT